MRKARSLEERQTIYVTDRQAMTQIEGGTGAIRGGVVGVHNIRVKSVRRIINRVTIRVGDTERQVADRAPHTRLQRVIYRVCLVVQSNDVAESVERPERIRVVTTGNVQTIERRARNGWSAWPCGRGRAVSRVHHIALCVIDLRCDRSSDANVRIVRR